MIFAQQSALALATGRERQLAGMIRLAWLWTFIVWVLARGGFCVPKANRRGWHLPDATGLWVTLLLILFSLWRPMFSGVLQGRQDFFWMGWSTILGGVGDLRKRNSGAGAGLRRGGHDCRRAASGVGIALVSIWRSRDLWSLRSEPFDGKGMMKQVVPLMFGFGACQLCSLRTRCMEGILQR